MGQDSSCGICGKHYQSCKHYVKEHIPNFEKGGAYCGMAGGELLWLDDDWKEQDIDTDDICLKCKKSYKKAFGLKSFEDAFENIENMGWAEVEL